MRPGESRNRLLDIRALRITLYAVSLFGVMSLLASVEAAGTRRALLVGVSNYLHVRDMDGPRFDVRSIRDALVEHWGFSPGDVRMLVDGDATKDAILVSLARLADESASGDQVLVYFSGHGTSALDPGATWPLPHTTGALIPVDFEPGGSIERQVAQLLVGRWDLRPPLEELDSKGVNVLVAVDACFSGNAVRGGIPPQGLVPRYVALEESNEVGQSSAIAREPLSGIRGRDRPGVRESYPYSRVVFLSAAAEFEYATDIGQAMLDRFPTRDGHPHGAFSDGLARVLTGELPSDMDGDGVLTYAELASSLASFMRDRGYPQTPQLLPPAESTAGLATRAALFGGRDLPAVGVPGPDSGGLRLQLSDGLSHLGVPIAALDGIILVSEDAELILQEKGGVIELLDAAGERLDAVEMGDVSRLEDLVRRESWLKRLSNLAGVRATGGLDVSLKGRAGAAALREGEAITLVIESTRNQYVTVLASDADGAFNLLFPVEPSEVRIVSRERPLLVPRAGSGDRIAVMPPFGRNVIVALGTAEVPGGLISLMERAARASTLRDVDLERFVTLTGQVQTVSTMDLLTVRSEAGVTGSTGRSR